MKVFQVETFEEKDEAVVRWAVSMFLKFTYFQLTESGAVKCTPLHRAREEV